MGPSNGSLSSLAGLLVFARVRAGFRGFCVLFGWGLVPSIFLNVFRFLQLERFAKISPDRQTLSTNKRSILIVKKIRHNPVRETPVAIHLSSHSS